mgnify:CR=1 FL=1
MGHGSDLAPAGHPFGAGQSRAPRRSSAPARAFPLPPRSRQGTFPSPQAFTKALPRQPAASVALAAGWRGSKNVHKKTKWPDSSTDPDLLQSRDQGAQRKFMGGFARGTDRGGLFNPSAGCSLRALCGFVRVNPGPMFSQRHRDTEEGSGMARVPPGTPFPLTVIL